MNTQEIRFQIPPYGSAQLSLPELLSVDGFQRLQAAVGAIAGGPPKGQAPAAAADPGAVEFDSWLAHLK